MKKKAFIIFLIATVASISASAQYNDHRGYNLDSLDIVAARFTPEVVANASEEELSGIISCWTNLMQGYNQINGVRSIYYGRKVLRLAQKVGWDNSVVNSCRYLGQHKWAEGDLDSAAVFYKMALEAIDRMAAGSTSFTSPEGYDKEMIDDQYSAMYGTLGNLYVDLERIPEALDYYAKAGEIFKEYGWKNSLAVLHNNMGELYYREKEYKKSLNNYELSLEYGREANDSLWIASPLTGMSVVYMAMGKVKKALRNAIEADKYFSANEDQEFMSRIETLEILSQAYNVQKKHALTTALLAIIAALLLAGAVAGQSIIKRLRKEQKETSSMLDETIEELRPEPEKAKGIHLNDREEQILELLKHGKTTPQIAEILFLSPETVKWYRKKLLAKFDVTNTAELIAKISN